MMFLEMDEGIVRAAKKRRKSASMNSAGDDNLRRLPDKPGDVSSACEIRRDVIVIIILQEFSYPKRIDLSVRRPERAAFLVGENRLANFNFHPLLTSSPRAMHAGE